jgi:hypothetical protein
MPDGVAPFLGLKMSDSQIAVSWVLLETSSSYREAAFSQHGLPIAFVPINGPHERMYRTLNHYDPSQPTLRFQQVI